MSLDQTVKNIISNVFGVEVGSINEGTNADNTHGWDSLGHLRLVLAIERELGITIEPKHFIKMLNYEGIIDVVKLYTEDR